MPKTNPDNIRAGDTVLVSLSDPNITPFLAVVKRFHPADRYLACYRPIDPADYLENEDFLYEGLMMCNIDYMKLHTRPPYVVQQKDRNYRQQRGNDAHRINAYKVPGRPSIYSGPLFSVISSIIYAMDREIFYGPSYHAIESLWIKANRPGLRGPSPRFSHHMIFNRKHLDRWVHNNLSRLIIGPT